MMHALVRRPHYGLEQWETYVDALKESGWETIEIGRGNPSVERHAVAYAETLLIDHDCEFVAPRAMRVVRLSAGARLHGGDVLKFGGRVWVGLGADTNAAGAAELAGQLAGYGVRVTTVPVASHLKEVLTALPDGTLIGHGLELDEPYLQVPEPSGASVVLLGGNRVMLAASAPATAELLRSRGFDVLTVDLSAFATGPTSLSIRLRGDC